MLNAKYPSNEIYSIPNPTDYQQIPMRGIKVTQYQIYNFPAKYQEHSHTCQPNNHADLEYSRNSFFQHRQAIPTTHTRPISHYLGFYLLHQNVRHVGNAEYASQQRCLFLAVHDSQHEYRDVCP